MLIIVYNSFVSVEIRLCWTSWMPEQAAEGSSSLRVLAGSRFDARRHVEHTAQHICLWSTAKLERHQPVTCLHNSALAFKYNVWTESAEESSSLRVYWIQVWPRRHTEHKAQHVCVWSTARSQGKPAQQLASTIPGSDIQVKWSRVKSWITRSNRPICS